jgi:hypothetical protein
MGAGGPEKLWHQYTCCTRLHVNAWTADDREAPRAVNATAGTTNLHPLRRCLNKHRRTIATTVRPNAAKTGKRSSVHEAMLRLNISGVKGLLSNPPTGPLTNAQTKLQIASALNFRSGLGDFEE